MSELDIHPLPARLAIERFRCLRLCVAEVEGRLVPARLRSISAISAFLETNARPTLGAEIRLMHPSAGDIIGTVTRITLDGIDVRLTGNQAAITFALVTIAADMTMPKVASTRIANRADTP